MPDDFARSIRNVISALMFVDPIDVFPERGQSERRIRFRQNPHVEFLQADDDTQSRIADLVRSALPDAIIQPLESAAATDNH
ncbi:hypothetical protein GR212_15825 [Rhizobium lusitanum]|uniref:Uncharacterized protein n=1 Tax=Rhizobium lusitanum TaxID=293958 RepID=A0A6L9U941_9HYPH|nr:hypothetical protein [Rhizobium lusitanum]NEI71048.1 hypothetical protein [Rhizobium lusitanum]